MRRTLLRTSDGVAIDAFYEPRAVPATDAAVAPGAAGERRGADREDPGGQGTRGDRGEDDAQAVRRAFDGAGAAGGRGTPAIVVAHGFTGDLERPHLRRIARVFARHAAVVTFSFRGHGRSGGHSTVGDREVLDLAAAVAWARQLGHRRVITVGFSMGGSVVLRHAALQGAGRAAGVRSTGEQTGAGAGAHAGAAGRERGAGGAERGAGGTGDRPAAMAEAGAEVRTKARPVVGAVAVGADAHADAVVSVSAPARWYYRGTAPMRRLHWLVTRPEGRIVGRYGFRTRIHSRDWDPVPLSPVESVPLIAPTPLLIVHGDRDPYFPLDHPRMLAAAAAAGAGDLWLEQGMGHAERATPDALLERIAAWSAAADRDGDVTGAP